MKKRVMWVGAMAVGASALMGMPAGASVSRAALAEVAPLAPPAPPEGQVKDDLLAGTEKFAQGASDVSEVNLDQNMMGMVKGHGKNADLAAKLDFMVVHSYTYDKPGMYRMEDFDNIRKRLTDGSWNCFIHTRDKTDSTDICARSSEHGETSEMVIMTAEAKEVTFVHMKGRMSLDDLQKMNGGMRRQLPAPPAPPSRPAPPAPGL